MMIYLNEEIIGLDYSLFMENSFVKNKEDFYFIAGEVSKNAYLAMKLIKTHTKGNYSLRPAKIYTRFSGQEEELEKEKAVNLKEKDYIIERFFSYFSYEDDLGSFRVLIGVVPIISNYVKNNYNDFCAYADYSEDSRGYKDVLAIEFLDIFRLEGRVVKGYYEGNIVLIDIKLINKYTRETIFDGFERVNLTNNLYIEDEEDANWMIEAFLESMSENCIREKLRYTLESLSEKVLV